MSRPVVTAIMLEDMRRQGMEIRLQKGAIITPAAHDWFREHSVPVAWEDGEKRTGTLAVVMNPSLPEMRAMRTMLDRIGGLVEVIEPADGKGGMVSATRRLCEAIVRNQVCKGVVFAVDGAMPVCVANKHKGIRASLGVGVPMVEEACRELGINVLVLEYPTQTTFQMRQMIDRLINCSTQGRAETLAMIEALEKGNGNANR
ncbi:MAG: RpiB/LacA/LacB family sugar-phosphate isomerase [Planctomycetota bacterium]|nr:MAG: RpiB/LacA/LacB family sugar-phosphate isomerase [Planctomycetota bacterium]